MFRKFTGFCVSTLGVRRSGLYRLQVAEKQDGKGGKPTDREARLKAALRDNLRKRKERDRAEVDGDAKRDA